MWEDWPEDLRALEEVEAEVDSSNLENKKKYVKNEARKWPDLQPGSWLDSATSIQKQTGQTQVKSSSFIRALNDYKKEESEEKKISRCFWDSSDFDTTC